MDVDSLIAAIKRLGRSSKVPTTISEYKLYDKLGEGTYGRVRLVQSRRTGRWFALKYISKTEPPNKLKSFLREHEVLKKIDHPLICNLQDAFQDSDCFYLALSYMPGGDLRQCLRTYTLSEEAVRTLIAEVSCALTYIHDSGFAHRDIKPENIVFDAHGHAHLCDFNIAAEMSHTKPILRGVSGTFVYQAPEVHRRLPYSHMADWWSLGCVFYECIYGRVPFRTRTSSGMVKKAWEGPKYMHTEPKVSDACVFAIQAFLKFVPGQRVGLIEEVLCLDFFHSLDTTHLEDISQPNPTLSACGHVVPELVANRRRSVATFVANEAQEWAKRKQDDGSEHQPRSFSHRKDQLKIHGELVNRRIKRLNNKRWKSNQEDTPPPLNGTEPPAAARSVLVLHQLRQRFSEFQYCNESNSCTSVPLSSTTSLTSATSDSAKTLTCSNEPKILPRGVIALGRAGKGSRIRI